MDDANRRYHSRRKSDLSMYYRYKMLTESVGLGLFECNIDDRIEYLNGPLAVMFGSSEDEMCGITWMEAIKVPPIDESLWNAYKHERKSFSFEYETEIDGTKKWFVVRIEPIEEANMGAIGTVNDITVEKTLLAELLELRSQYRGEDDDGAVASRQ